MKIGMMADMYKPYSSGVINHIDITSKALVRSGHEVTIFTFGESDHYDEGENVIRTKGIPLSLPFADLNFQISRDHSPDVIKKIQSMDIVNVHHPFMSGEMAIRYCSKNKIPVVFTSHTRYDLYAQIYASFLPREFVNAFISKRLKSTCTLFDAVITPSKSSKRMYDSLGIHANFINIPNGISISNEFFREYPDRRQSLGYIEDNIVILYLGRIGIEKNLPLLIDVFHQVVKVREKSRLLIVGRGREKDKLIQKVNKLGLDKKVQMIGFVPYEDILSYMQAADIFFTTSVTEIHPLSVLEAMWAGLPIVGINQSGVGDLIEDHKSGLLSSLNTEDIGSNLIDLIDNPGLRNYLGQEAKNSAKKYSIENTIPKLLQCYKDLINKRRTY